MYLVFLSDKYVSLNEFKEENSFLSSLELVQIYVFIALFLSELNNI